MKMKRFFALLLAAVMCLSMCIMSCGNSEEEEEEAASADKQVIIDKVEEINFKDIVTATLEQLDQQTSLDSLLKEFNAEIDCSATMMGETIPFYVGSSNGLIKVTSPAGDNGYVFINNNSYVAIAPAHGTLEVSVTGVEESAPIPPLDELEAYLTDDILAILESFTLEAPKEKQLKKSGDFYVLTSSYYENMAESVIDFVAAISEETNGYYPSEEEKAEAVTQITDIVDALDLEIGFAVSGENIVGIKLAVDPDMELINDLIYGGYYDDPAIDEDYYEYSEDMAVSGSTAIASAKFKVGFEIMFTDDLKNIKSFNAELDYDTGVAAMTGSVSLDSIFSDGTLMGTNIAVDIYTPEVPYTNTINENDNGYTETQYYAAYNVSLNGFIDFTKAENVGAKVIDLSGELTVTPVRKEVVAYDYNYNKIEVDYDPNDVSDIDRVIVSATVGATVSKLGSMDVALNIDGTADGESITVTGNGYVSWMEAENFGAVHVKVLQLFDDASAAERITDLENRIREMDFNLGYSDYSLWYDDVTGYYVLFYYGSQYDYSILFDIPDVAYSSAVPY